MAAPFEAAVHALRSRAPISDIRNLGLMAAIDLQPRPDAVGARGYEALVRAYFSGTDPLGKRFKAGGIGAPQEPWITVVGVVGDVRQASLQIDPRPAVGSYGGGSPLLRVIDRHVGRE